MKNIVLGRNCKDCSKILQNVNEKFCLFGNIKYICPSFKITEGESAEQTDQKMWLWQMMVGSKVSPSCLPTSSPCQHILLIHFILSIIVRDVLVIPGK